MNVLEFTSSRKRMGLILRGPNQKIKLLVKGAVSGNRNIRLRRSLYSLKDSTIFERLTSDGAHHLEATCNHLTIFANLGVIIDLFPAV